MIGQFPYFAAGTLLNSGPAHVSYSVLGVDEAVDVAIRAAPAPTSTNEQGSRAFLFVVSLMGRLLGRARKACLYTTRRSKGGNGMSRVTRKATRTSVPCDVVSDSREAS
jgi:hypothetical protein